MRKPKVKVQKGKIDPSPFSYEMSTFPQKLLLAEKQAKKRRNGQTLKKA